MMFLLSIIGFYGVEKLKGKYVFRKIGTIHVWYIVSSVAQNEILWTSVIQAVSRHAFECVQSKLIYNKMQKIITSCDTVTGIYTRQRNT